MRKISFIFTCVFLLLALSGGVTGKKKQIPREITQILEIDAATIQTQADHLFSQLSALLESPRNREDIVNYLTQFRELSYSIDLGYVKDAANSVADYFFDVVERLRSRTRETLLAISEINTKNLNHSFVDEVSNQFSNLMTFVKNEIKLLKDKGICTLAKLFFQHYEKLSRTRRLEHINRLQKLFDSAIEEVHYFFRRVIGKAQDSTGILILAQNLASSNATLSLEREIRSISRELAANLEGFRVGFFRNLATNYIDLLYNNLYDLRTDLYLLAGRALEFHENELRREAYPDNSTNETSNNGTILPRGAAGVLNERLESLRQSFGERVVAFRESTIAELVRIVRDTVNAAGLRNIPELNDPNFYSAVSSTISQIRGNIQRLSSNIREIYQIELQEYLQRWRSSRGY